MRHLPQGERGSLSAEHLIVCKLFPDEIFNHAHVINQSALKAVDILEEGVKVF